MDLDEDVEVEPVAQEPIVLNRGLAGEKSEELFLLLLCLVMGNGSSRTSACRAKP